MFLVFFGKNTRLRRGGMPLPKVRETENRRLFPKKPSSRMTVNLSKKGMPPTFGSRIAEAE